MKRGLKSREITEQRNNYMTNLQETNVQEENRIKAYDENLNMTFDAEDLYLLTDYGICFLKGDTFYVYDLKGDCIDYSSLRIHHLGEPCPRIFVAYHNDLKYEVDKDAIRLYQEDILIETVKGFDAMLDIVNELRADVFIKYESIITYFDDEVDDCEIGLSFTIADFDYEDPEHTYISFLKNDTYYKYNYVDGEIDTFSRETKPDLITSNGFYDKRFNITFHHEDCIQWNDKKMIFKKDNKTYRYHELTVEKIQKERLAELDELMANGFYDPDYDKVFTKEDIIEWTGEHLLIRTSEYGMAHYDYDEIRLLKKAPKKQRPDQWLINCILTKNPRFSSFEQVEDFRVNNYLLSDNNHLLIVIPLDKYNEHRHYDPNFTNDANYIYYLGCQAWAESWQIKGENDEVKKIYETGYEQPDLPIPIIPVKTTPQGPKNNSAFASKTNPQPNNVVEAKPQALPGKKNNQTVEAKAPGQASKGNTSQDNPDKAPNEVSPVKASNEAVPVKEPNECVCAPPPEANVEASPMQMTKEQRLRRMFDKRPAETSNTNECVSVPPPEASPMKLTKKQLFAQKLNKLNV